eukprot:s9045_g3.t1
MAVVDPRGRGSGGTEDGATTGKKIDENKAEEKAYKVEAKMLQQQLTEERERPFRSCVGVKDLQLEVLTTQQLLRLSEEKALVPALTSDLDRHKRLVSGLETGPKDAADPTHNNRNHVLLIQAKHRTKDKVTEELSEELQTSEEAQALMKKEMKEEMRTFSEEKAQLETELETALFEEVPTEVAYDAPF